MTGTKRIRKKKRLALAALCMAMLALPGCGPDNDTPDITVPDVYVADASETEGIRGASTGQSVDGEAKGLQPGTRHAQAGLPNVKDGDTRPGGISGAVSSQSVPDGAAAGDGMDDDSGGDGNDDAGGAGGPGWVLASDIGGMPDGGHANGLDALDVPAWSGEPYMELHEGKPYFQAPSSTSLAKSVSALDLDGRPGPAYALLGPDDVTDRGLRREGNPKKRPSGMTNMSYDGLVPGGALYAERRLLPWIQDVKGGADENMLAATRYLADQGMAPIEDEVSDYIARTGNHAAYRVTPVYKGLNLLCDGVVIEAVSVEDNGEGLSLCRFCYNVQPGVELDYGTGLSRLTGETEWHGDDGMGNDDYVVDKKTGTFHHTGCGYVTGILVKYRDDYRGMRDGLLEEGYLPCKSCQP